jgi:putative oxidoreductase
MLKKLLSTGQYNQITNIALLILRVGFSIGMITHGYPKFIKMIQGDWKFGDPLGIGVQASLISVSFSEFICSILIIMGLTTRYALIPLIFTMLVAWLIVHGSDPFSSQEKAFLYFVVYLVLFMMGPGKYSLDKKLFG